VWSVSEWARKKFAWRLPTLAMTSEKAWKDRPGTLFRFLHSPTVLGSQRFVLDLYWK
jgi:hypothetical protein